MRQRPLGRTGCQVSEIGLASWPREDNGPVRVVRRALDLGCTLFDAGSPLAEELLGRALEGERDRVVVAARYGSDLAPEAGRQALAAALRRLRTDYVDLLLVESPSLEQIRDGQVFEPLERFQREGQIRWYGAAVRTAAEGLAVLAASRAHAIEVPFSHAVPNAGVELMPAAGRAGAAVLARSALAGGFLTGRRRATDSFGDGDPRVGWPAAERARLVDDMRRMAGPRHVQGTPAQRALRWCLVQPALAAVVVGCRLAWQVDENFAASELGPLAPQELLDIDLEA